MKRVIITGPPCTGKTTIINALHRSGYAIKNEVARSIIDFNFNDIIRPRGHRNMFDSLVFNHMLHDYLEIENIKLVFYDGGFPDIIAYEIFLHQEYDLFSKLINYFPYYSKVYITEPWEEIYIQDEYRPWSFNDIIELNKIIRMTYVKLGYEIINIPKFTTVETRLNFITNTLIK